jgi:hypothetical protein
MIVGEPWRLGENSVGDRRETWETLSSGECISEALAD